MHLNLGLVAIIITLLIIGNFPLWKRISGRMGPVTSGYAGRECMGYAGMPAVRRSDQPAYRLERKFWLFQIYFQSLQYRKKNTDDNIYHGNPDFRR